MKVQRIRLGPARYTYLLIGEDMLPVDDVNRYLKYLSNIQKSPNTIHTYCTALKFFYEFMEESGLHLCIGISESDVAKYKVLMSSANAMVQIGINNDRPELISENRELLDRYNLIHNSLEKGNIISSLSLSAKSESSMQKRMLSDNNKDSVIDALKRKISTLEAENKALKTQLECAYERYYDKL